MSKQSPEPGARPEFQPSDRDRDRGFQLGEVFLETMATGIITQQEIDWLTLQQTQFNRDEEAKALRLGRLLDEGEIQIGCRLIGPHRPVVEHQAGAGSSGFS